VYASELAAERREEIAARRAAAGASQLRVIEGAREATNLPDGCCDAVYLRAVFHHLDDQPGFARAIARAVRPGGRVAVIDFPPGSLWFHGADHGVTPDAVIAAFAAAGLEVAQRTDDWGGGMFLIVFAR
jgi:ubiquinone/menaquinone biosynthesis C-methylase UbiE